MLHAKTALPPRRQSSSSPSRGTSLEHVCRGAPHRRRCQMPRSWLPKVKVLRHSSCPDAERKKSMPPVGSACHARGVVLAEGDAGLGGLFREYSAGLHVCDLAQATAACKRNESAVDVCPRPLSSDKRTVSIALARYRGTVEHAENEILCHAPALVALTPAALLVAGPSGLASTTSRWCHRFSRRLCARDRRILPLHGDVPAAACHQGCAAAVDRVARTMTQSNCTE